ncbi:MAG: class I SAM-dependent methyltransferase [Methanoregula sp.]|nr:class I SAM-dependent methyltransferase [Methanoregula sp.]
MGRGIRFALIERILKKKYRGGSVLEIAAGGCLYRDLFEDYVSTDLPASSYYDSGDICVFCDGQVLPFKENSFDFVFMIAALYQIKTPELLIKEVSRVLKPRGQFIVFDYNKPRLIRVKNVEHGVVNHIWHPWELETLLKKYPFRTTFLLLEDYSFTYLGKVLSIIYKIPGAYCISNIFFEGWSIVHAEKRIR